MEEDPGWLICRIYLFAECKQDSTTEVKVAKKEKGVQVSTGELEGMQIADSRLSFIHGKAIQAAGSFSFVSCSDESVESGEVPLDAYDVVDLILFGKREYKWHSGRTDLLQNVLFCHAKSINVV